MQPVLIIHGGAGGAFSAKGGSASGGKDPRRKIKVRKKISRILTLAYQKLIHSDALEAVTYAVKLLEDDSEFNAGTGSQLQSDGRARLTAAMMDGATQHFAGVINIEKIKNPILVARALLREKDRVLAGDGAFRYAIKKLGLKPVDTRTKDSILRWRQWKKQKGSGSKKGSDPFWGSDTVGACALDRFGNLASATSTGGRGFEFPGRVSDSGMPVANYADERCAVCATGIGEEIIDEGLAVKVATRVEDGSTLAQAFRKTFAELGVRKRRIGAIGLNSKGKVFYLTTTEILIGGWQDAKGAGIFV